MSSISRFGRRPKGPIRLNTFGPKYGRYRQLCPRILGLFVLWTLSLMILKPQFEVKILGLLAFLDPNYFAPLYFWTIKTLNPQVLHDFGTFGLYGLII